MAKRFSLEFQLESAQLVLDQNSPPRGGQSHECGDIYHDPMGSAVKR